MALQRDKVKGGRDKVVVVERRKKIRLRGGGGVFRAK
jgi:hypothetical protein